MNQVKRTCWTCGEARLARFDTDGRGNLVEVCPPCACERGAAAAASARKRALQDDETVEDRKDLARRTGECMDCGAPVAGTRGRALCCAAHKAEAKRAQMRADYRRHLEARRDADRRRWRSDPEAQRRKAVLKRERHRERMASDPAYAKAYRLQRQRETLFTHPRYEARLEYFRRTNAEPERAERRRELARRKYYELHPERPSPVCATCSAPIPYSGTGAPPKYHQTPACNPHLRSPSQRRRAA